MQADATWRPGIRRMRALRLRQEPQYSHPKSPRVYSPKQNPASAPGVDCPRSRGQTLTRPIFQLRLLRNMAFIQVASSPLPARPKLVLDTNAVLDWMVFDNPSSKAITAAILCRKVDWIVNESVRGELLHVLGRGVVDRWRPDITRLWEEWARHSTPTELPIGPSPAHRPRCTDKDDQKFIDLALATGAKWLITRDRALLKLARRASALNLSILKPEQFAISDEVSA